MNMLITARVTRGHTQRKMDTTFHGGHPRTTTHPPAQSVAIATRACSMPVSISASIHQAHKYDRGEMCQGKDGENILFLDSGTSRPLSRPTQFMSSAGQDSNRPGVSHPYQQGDVQFPPTQSLHVKLPWNQ